MTKTITTTREYDEDGNVIKETTVENVTEQTNCTQPHYPCQRPHLYQYWGQCYPNTVYIGTTTLGISSVGSSTMALRRK